MPTTVDTVFAYFPKTKTSYIWFDVDLLYKCIFLAVWRYHSAVVREQCVYRLFTSVINFFYNFSNYCTKLIY